MGRHDTTPLRTRDFIFFKPVERFSEAYTASFTMGSLGSFPGGKKAEAWL
jgi:hypothetical protein